MHMLLWFTYIIIEFYSPKPWLGMYNKKSWVCCVYECILNQNSVNKNNYVCPIEESSLQWRLIEPKNSFSRMTLNWAQEFFIRYNGVLYGGSPYITHMPVMGKCMYTYFCVSTM